MTGLSDRAALAMALRHGCEALKLNLQPEQYEQLLDYLALLLKWNAVYNLTAVREPEKMLTHHLLDSLAIVAELDKLAPQNILDVGSGGGLPGIVIAIVRPHWHVTVNDTVQKKSAFQTQVKALLKLGNLQVAAGRVEQFSFANQFDVVVSRAFAELSDFVNLAGQHLQSSGWLVAMKGQLPTEEISRLPLSWQVKNVVSLQVPMLDAERHLILIQAE
ncbi:16S rRNA (guanine(527)-N(7))-methyltransferase RsmG [Ampullimonas aquatilis]|uniref:16S rRNA (guanine(527)-N(7))-methyltransferase RsmG n=1 Tax=Ampullimonas aquatilis TaxID=1341549 RepID=UPI003C721808